MHIDRKIEILEKFSQLLYGIVDRTVEVDEPLNDLKKEGRDLIQQAHHHNGWFVTASVEMAFLAWAKALEKDSVKAWLKAYAFNDTVDAVGVIMAGNIPLVGLHDAIAVLVSDHQLVAKLSSKDQLLMEFVLRALGTIAPEWKEKIVIGNSLKNIDVLIATGSDNSARYFEYYFREKKKLIRQNRTSVAILNGSETSDELSGLASDVFTYFGLGCRNITKLYLPKNYDLDLLFQAFFPYQKLINNNKYANNYDYNKAVYLLNKIELIENGFLLLKEDEGLHSPVGVLFYEYYEDLEELELQLNQSAEHIQCIVSNLGKATHTPFGKAQNPDLWDYADGVDTLAFLNET